MSINYSSSLPNCPKYLPATARHTWMCGKDGSLELVTFDRLVASALANARTDAEVSASSGRPTREASA
jgi:hypothetical protein